MGVTIKELSRACGLSISAVSKALNGYPDVSEKTRRRVLEAAREMGYFPSAAARGLKTNRMYALGVLLSVSSGSGLLHPFFAVLLDGFNKEASERGYDVTLINHSESSPLTYLDHCRQRNVDGVGLLSVDFTNPQIQALAASDMPLVSIDHAFDGKECVRSDNRRGIADILAHVAAMGHRRVAFIHGTPRDVTIERVEAFTACTRALGLTLEEGYLVPSQYQSTQAQEAPVRRLLALPRPPTCILMPDDYSALGGIEALRQAGLRVPEDMSVVGYDGIWMIQKVHPQLTTLRQDGPEMGRRAARRLIDRIEQPDAPLTAPDIIPGELLLGETVLPI